MTSMSRVLRPLGIVLFAVTVHARNSTSSPVTAAQITCNFTSFSNSLLSFTQPGSLQYELDMEHFSPSASENATCSIGPTTPQDVASLIKLINQTRTPWAVKGHGHTYNQGFSSTTGLQISLAKFNEVSYDPRTKLATIGTGNSWDLVYPILDAQGVMVVGGRIPTVGTGGLMLGGGYSYKTNQFGLACDNTVEYTLVTYTGQILQVNQTSDPDLFFALQGGLNNFGIVTSYTMTTHVQTPVVGGILNVPSQNITLLKEALLKYCETNKDPKAVINPVFAFINGELTAFIFILYDGPQLPNGTFSDFIALGANLTQTSFSEFVAGFPENQTDAPIRIADHTAPIVGYTTELIDFIANETIFWGQLLSTNHSGVGVTITPEIFLSTSFSNSRQAAYPHSVQQFWNPLNTEVRWLDPSEDEFFNNATKTIAGRIQDKAIQLGKSSADALLYPNYVVADTPLHLLYGDNVARLAQISKAHDPNNLLGLTGGFKLNP